jgi:hypothetical protein
MKKILLLLLLSLITAGCSTLDTAKIAASHAVSKYCEIPESARGLAREQLANAVSPNSIKVSCSGDE